MDKITSPNIEKPSAATDTVHKMTAGRTPCPMSAEHGAPLTWPRGHVWSQLWKDVNCEDCLTHKPADAGQ